MEQVCEMPHKNKGRKIKRNSCLVTLSFILLMVKRDNFNRGIENMQYTGISSS